MKKTILFLCSLCCGVAAAQRPLSLQQLKDSALQNNFSIRSARLNIAAAQQQLTTLDPGSAKYQAVQNAADYLRMLIGSSYANADDVMTAVENLTKAMGGIF